jgi:hypothetical protein
MMGREVRRVPATWQHPKDERGHYVPLYSSFPGYTESEIAEGLEDGRWLADDPPHYGLSIMPEWPEAEKTHYQMYETCSEGTPISPVMESPEALAAWLAETGASSFGGLTATYEQWLRVCRGGYAPTAIMMGGVLMSGVAGMPEGGAL